MLYRFHSLTLADPVYAALKALLQEELDSSSLSSHFELFVYAAIGLLAAAVRFFKIWHPAQVVWVHKYPLRVLL